MMNMINSLILQEWPLAIEVLYELNKVDKKYTEKEENNTSGQM
jgi:hypothetical protein